MKQAEGVRIGEHLFPGVTVMIASALRPPGKVAAYLVHEGDSLRRAELTQIEDVAEFMGK
jgi:hypothetical protein